MNAKERDPQMHQTSRPKPAITQFPPTDYLGLSTFIALPTVQRFPSELQGLLSRRGRTALGRDGIAVRGCRAKAPRSI